MKKQIYAGDVVIMARILDAVDVAFCLAKFARCGIHIVLTWNLTYIRELVDFSEKL